MAIVFIEAKEDSFCVKQIHTDGVTLIENVGSYNTLQRAMQKVHTDYISEFLLVAENKIFYDVRHLDS